MIFPNIQKGCVITWNDSFDRAQLKAPYNADRATAFKIKRSSSQE
eukprot:CAMPEP_0115057448 /NCGR_PEP_ID=MMETSP0227-20121206/5767_1 /TAXON_ID=89957 /ORGANISM="Polarella glacialis, Strain CCMP 1383" /LENGTH=44 /DNA_ID= /DNA_START= /DNA_END= /DNA_ORIENTATION=